VLLARSIDGGHGEIIEQFVGFAIQYAIALLNGGLAEKDGGNKVRVLSIPGVDM
jgi:hypothetical protein